MNESSRPQQSMVRYRRLPAALTLGVVFACGGLLILLHARSAHAAGAAGPAHWSLEQLEVAIGSGSADSQTWYYYGQRLLEQKRYTGAVAAYKKSLDADPTNHEARFRCGLALAQCGADDELYAFLKDLVLSDPKLAEDVFDAPECHQPLADARFKSLAQEAHLQAMD